MVSSGIEPYERGIIKGDPFVSVSPTKFRIVAVLDLSVSNRQLEILSTRSRSASQYSVWEFVVTEEDVQLGGQVDSVSYLGFGEALRSGQLVVGRPVQVQGRRIGRIGGFDETHAPNHINVVLHVEHKATGHELDLKLGDTIQID